MDINILKQYKNTISTTDLEGLMRPTSEFEDILKCNFKDLLELQLIEIPNLYKADKKTLKFRHDSNLVVSKFEGKIRETVEFEVNFDRVPFFECGINYLGRLRVVGTKRYIRVFGEGSYDPASREPYLTRHDYVIITGFYCAALFALRKGGEDSLRKIFKIFKLNKTCQNRKYLVSYMKYQIEETVIFKRISKDYGLFLKEDAKFLKHQLLRKENEDLVMYMNLFELCLKTEMFPSEKYINSLIRVRGDSVSSSPLIKFIESHKKTVYLFPDVNLVKQIAKVDKNQPLFDMRVLRHQLDNLEEEYTKRMKEALNNKDGGMKKLTEPYTNCELF